MGTVYEAEQAAIGGLAERAENGVAFFPWMTDFDRRLSALGNEQVEMDRR